MDLASFPSFSSQAQGSWSYDLRTIRGNNLERSLLASPGPLTPLVWSCRPPTSECLPLQVPAVSGKAPGVLFRMWLLFSNPGVPPSCETAPVTAALQVTLPHPQPAGTASPTSCPGLCWSWSSCLCVEPQSTRDTLKEKGDQKGPGVTLLPVSV